MKFQDFSAAVSAQFDKLSQHQLYVTQCEKDLLWDTYLAAFPVGSNPLFRERTEHDCNCCKGFIRAVGNVVAFVGDELQTIWDIEIGGHYQMVADAMAEVIKAQTIDTIFLRAKKHGQRVGSLPNADNYDPAIKWNHFNYLLPPDAMAGSDIDQRRGLARQNYQTLKRSLTEISPESVSLVLDLIAQNSLYRGEEHQGTLTNLQRMQREHAETVNSDQLLWEKSLALGAASNIRGMAIGTLLVDLSQGVELDRAVASFETKVAPANYKRTTALITPKMIEAAQQKVQALGIEDALYRRFAAAEDLTITNVLFADRSAKKSMGAFDAIAGMAKQPAPDTKNVQEMTVDEFLANVVPRADTIELLVENRHQPNFMSLLAPIHQNAASILKWGNNFTWAYTGDVADSDMRRNVKAAGGNVDGVLRFSIQWNTPERPNLSDLDAHCSYPGGLIYFGGKTHRSGSLDVDIINPKGVAVENIIFTDLAFMPDGDYRFLVHNYTDRPGAGFTAELELNGQILHFSYDAALKHNQKVFVADVVKEGHTLTVVDSMKHSESNREIWGVHTNQFVPVRMLLNSPNHWDGEQTGNRHLFFILDGCNNPDDARGFYNEFLREDLREHRKVFEVLGSQLKAKHSDNQLSGLGFSSTQQNSVTCRVRGSFNRMVKVTF